MKRFVVIVVVCVWAVNAQLFNSPGKIAGVSPDLVAKMRKSALECVAKTGVSPAEITKVLGSNLPEGKQACFLACLLKTNGAMGSDNKINTDAIKTMIAPMADRNKERFDKLSTGLDTCKAQQSSPNSDECVAARDFKKCMIENM